MSINRQDETITLTLMELAVFLSEAAGLAKGHPLGHGATGWVRYIQVARDAKDNPLPEKMINVLKAYGQ